MGSKKLKQLADIELEYGGDALVTTDLVRGGYEISVSGRDNSGDFYELILTPGEAKALSQALDAAEHGAPGEEE